MKRHNLSPVAQTSIELSFENPVRRYDMKRIILIVILMLVFSGSAFSAHSGVNGWLWNKAADSMTDKVIFVFLKASDEGVADPAFGLRYSPADKHWVWGFISSGRDWGDKVFTCRFGKDPAQDRGFAEDGPWIERNITDDATDLGTFVKYPSIVIRLGPGEEYRYDMRGLAETIRMAGLSLK
jgi:hypothetical protein